MQPAFISGSYFNYLQLFCLIPAMLLWGLLPKQMVAQENGVPRYKSQVVDTFFGTPVPDPYRWLESLHSDSTTAWLNAQQALTAKEKKKFGVSYIGFFDDFAGERFKWYNQVKHGPWYFSLRYHKGEQTFLCYRKSLTGDDELAFDPNIYPMYEGYSLAGYAVNDDASYVAVALSKGGSDWCEIRVKRMLQDVLLDDKIEWVKFSNIVWWGEGFFYSKFKSPPTGATHTAANTGQQLYYHHLGTHQYNDSLVYANSENADYVFSFYLTPDKRYLIIDSKSDTGEIYKNIVYYKDLRTGLQSSLKVLTSTKVASDTYFEVLDVKDDKFIALTNWHARRNKIVLLGKDTVNGITEFIPQAKNQLGSAHVFGGKILCVYKSLDSGYALIYNYNGKPWRKLQFNPCTTVSGFNAQPADSEAVFWESSFHSQPVAYVFNIHQGKVVYSDKEAKENLKTSDYTTTMAWYKSKDGTDVPMYLTYRKGLNLKGNNPVLINGYGGYGISMSPAYSPFAKQFCSYGGIYAVALIRGGGEKGEQWHNDGKLLKKQNSFNDFIAAAEYLTSNGYTSKEKLAIMGGSNGGLLIGAIITQRPDLFKVAIAQVGVYDMLRYQYFTGGKFWDREYGLSSDSTEFKNLLSYSPLHNLKPGIAYPAVLLTTAGNDDRVPPLHTFKFLAALQENSIGNEPHLLYFEEEAGHHGPQVKEHYEAQEAFELSFIFDELKMKRRANN